MDIEVKSEEVKYMLERTASLILTDCRRNFKLNNFERSVGLNHLDKNQTIFHIPCLLSLNIVRLWPSFKKVVLNNINKLNVKDGPSNKRNKDINWNRTFENILIGKNEPFFNERKSADQFSEFALIYYVTVEYLMHIEEILFFFTENHTPEFLKQIYCKIEEIKKDISYVLGNVIIPKEFSQTSIIKQLKLEFRLLLNESFKSSNAFRKYLEMSSNFLNSLRVHNLQEFGAIGWRKEYLNLNTGLGKGKDLIIGATTDIPHLYELWCFYEFIAVLLEKNQLKIAQNCFINSKKNLQLFSINNNGNIYYNYLGELTSGQNSSLYMSKILKRTCVEWYIEYHNHKIIFDTKYKNWNSNDNLTVIGYISDFKANAGVVVFSNDFDASAYNSSVGNDNIICVSLGENNKKKFIALLLKPIFECQIQNRATLSLLVDYLFSGN